MSAEHHVASSPDLTNASPVQQSIEYFWDTLKNPAAKKFLLESSDVGLTSLIDFFSRSDQFGFAEMPVNISTARYLALEYYNIGAYSNAKTMTICGAFFKQCQSVGTPIGVMKTMAPLHIKDETNPVELPHFFQGLKASRDQSAMSAHLQSVLPMKYTKMLGVTKHDKHTPSIEYCDIVGRDWNNGNARPKRRQAASDDDTEITVVFRGDDGSSKDEVMVAKRSDVMRNIFNQFAETSGASLRSQRFSYQGSMLFLSSVGNKSLDQMGLQDNDVIEVTSLVSVREPAPAACAPSPSKKKAGGKKKSQRKNNGERSKRQTAEPKYVANSSEQDKLAHSLKLTRVIEEMEPRLKLIRQQLNCSMLKVSATFRYLELSRPVAQRPVFFFFFFNQLLTAKRQSSKIKKLRPRSKSPDSVAFVPNPASDGLGGKAGKTSYQINVGVNDNLYSTSKNQGRRRSSATIDLHGFTKSEATDKLDEVLPSLVDEAARGSYPFVISANIVCGGGSQELSETVATWIKKTKCVANAPK